MKFCHPSAPCSANALQTKDTLVADGLARMARGRTSHRKSTGRRVSRFHSSVVPAHCETEDRFTFCLPLLYQNSMLGWVKLALPPALCPLSPGKAQRQFGSRYTPHPQVRLVNSADSAHGPQCFCRLNRHRPATDLTPTLMNFPSKMSTRSLRIFQAEFSTANGHESPRIKTGNSRSQNGGKMVESKCAISQSGSCATRITNPTRDRVDARSTKLHERVPLDTCGEPANSFPSGPLSIHNKSRNLKARKFLL